MSFSSRVVQYNRPTRTPSLLLPRPDLAPLYLTTTNATKAGTQYTKGCLLRTSEPRTPNSNVHRRHAGRVDGHGEVGHVPGDRVRPASGVSSAQLLPTVTMDPVGPELLDGLFKRSVNSEFLNKISQLLNIGLKFYSSSWDTLPYSACELPVPSLHARWLFLKSFSHPHSPAHNLQPTSCLTETKSPRKLWHTSSQDPCVPLQHSGLLPNVLCQQTDLPTLPGRTLHLPLPKFWSSAHPYPIHVSNQTRLSEVSQRNTIPLSLICSIYFLKMIQMNSFTKQKWLPKGKKWGGNKSGAQKGYTLLYQRHIHTQ